MPVVTGWHRVRPCKHQGISLCKPSFCHSPSLGVRGAAAGEGSVPSRSVSPLGTHHGVFPDPAIPRHRQGGAGRRSLPRVPRTALWAGKRPAAFAQPNPQIWLSKKVELSPGQGGWKHGLQPDTCRGMSPLDPTAQPRCPPSPAQGTWGASGAAVVATTPSDAGWQPNPRQNPRELQPAQNIKNKAID